MLHSVLCFIGFSFPPYFFLLGSLVLILTMRRVNNPYLFGRGPPLDVLSTSLLFLVRWSSFYGLTTTSLSVNTPCVKLGFVLCQLFFFSFVGLLHQTSSFWFFIFIEFTLIPVVLIVALLGPAPERSQALMYLWLFTMVAALPFILFALTQRGLPLWVMANSLSLLSNYDLAGLSMCILFVFIVKTPVYFLHLWLPQAHVQASTLGSVLLAAVVLKLSTFGLVRVRQPLSHLPPSSLVFFTSFVLVGAAYSSLQSFLQLDLKSLIAYSSVCHIALPTFILINQPAASFQASLLIILGHGFVSAALFTIGAQLSYTFLSRRLLVTSGGALLNSSVIAFWCLVLCFNISCPPFMSF